MFSRAVWERVGGYPEWLDYCEDLVFDLALRHAGCRFAFGDQVLCQDRSSSSSGDDRGWLVLLSVVVGVVFSALGITPFNLIERLQHLIRNITDMGLDAFNWAFKYFLLGAVIVFPIWFLVRLLGSRRSPPKP